MSTSCPISAELIIFFPLERITNSASPPWSHTFLMASRAFFIFTAWSICCISITTSLLVLFFMSLLLSSSIVTSSRFDPSFPIMLPQPGSYWEVLSSVGYVFVVLRGSLFEYRGKPFSHSRPRSLAVSDYFPSSCWTHIWLLIAILHEVASVGLNSVLYREEGIREGLEVLFIGFWEFLCHWNLKKSIGFSSCEEPIFSSCLFAHFQPLALKYFVWLVARRADERISSSTL